MKVVVVNARGYRVGGTHQRAKLTDDEVDLILFLRDAGLSYRAIAAKFDDDKTISFSQVRKVCTGANRAQTPDRYKTVGVHLSGKTRGTVGP